jgi:cysteine desulfurase
MEGVSVSTGSACSSGSGLPSPVLLAMKLPLSKVDSSLRFSLGWGNNFDDIDLVVKILAKAVTINLTKSFKPF